MISALLFFLGLCLGSFVNALVWRLHEQARHKSQVTSLKSKVEGQKRAPSHSSLLTPHSLSIVHGRSMCPNCHHTLKATDLVPVFSWLILRGKCRYCQKPISWQYPLVELLTATLFVLSYLHFPLSLLSPLSSLLLLLWLAIVVILTALALYDLKHMLLPTKLVTPVTVLAVLYVVVLAVSTGSFSTILLAIGGLLSVGGLFWVLYQVSQGKWIGGGDVSLGFALGLLVGTPLKGLAVIFIASVFGSAIALVLIAVGKQKLHGKMPFGPLLITATILVYLYGDRLIAGYKQLFLL